MLILLRKFRLPVSMAVHNPQDVGTAIINRIDDQMCTDNMHANGRTDFLTFTTCSRICSDEFKTLDQRFQIAVCLALTK